MIFGGLNVKKIRKDFPILGKGIVYMDNACMPLRPVQVIDAVVDYYRNYPACVGRSQHALGMRATEEVRRARELISKFFNSKNGAMMFTKNTTESLNLIANTFMKDGGKVLTTDKEHNSNLLPWLMHKKVEHTYVKSLPDNTFDMEAFEDAVNGVKLVSMVHTANLDGTTIPLKEIVKVAHDAGAKVMIDAAQSAAHSHLDLKKLDVDFMACSGHKMLGPTGIGALYVKNELIDSLGTFIVGGETVVDSTYDSYKLEPAPMRFEAGLQHYAGIIGFGAAVKYLNKIGMSSIHKHEVKLNRMISAGLPDVKLIGPKDASLRGGIFSFNILGKDPHEVALLLDSGYDIMVRSGAHCVHSWFNAHNLSGSVRASLNVFNTEEEVKKFVDAVKEIGKF